MLKQEFLDRLQAGLNGLPQEDIEERLNFYSEMVDDAVEEGLSEQEAVAAVGPVSEIIAQVIEEIPFARIAAERIKPKRRLKTWETVLLALGSPIWFSLLVAAAAVVFALYISWWAVIVSLWAAFASFAAGILGGAVAGIVFICYGNVPSGIVMIAAGIVCAGLSFFAFYGCKAATKGTMVLTNKIVVWAKNCFIKKEEQND